MLFCGITVAAGVECGFSDPAPGQSGQGGTGAGGNATGTAGTGGRVTPSGSGGAMVGTGSGGMGGTTAGAGGTTPGAGGTMTGNGGTMTGAGGVMTGNGGMAGTAGPGTGGMGGAATGMGGAAGGPAATFMNYQIHGNWPEFKSVVATKPGTLAYTKVQVHDRFWGESCSIADYNKDGIPDVSSGRRWFEGPAFTAAHIFRGGHDDLPRNGDANEITEGVSDDWSDFPFDVDGDSWPDIINIASSDANTMQAPAPMPQLNATAFWYKNPGATAATAMWTPNLIHNDVRHEQHGVVDVDGDGKPEIFGACKNCNPQQTKGYYKAGANPTAPWTYVPVTGQITFPFGGTGWMHGLGFGDVNGDGKPDLLDRAGVWLQPATGTAWTNVVSTLYDGDPALERGGSHMFSFDVDGDGDLDIVAADGSHHWGLSWYEQVPPMRFIKHQFMGTNSPADLMKYGIGFSEPHALHVADMDGDGVPDIITGKKRFAHPISLGDPDPLGAPVLYVFRTVRNKVPANGNGGTVTFEPKLVDNMVGVGRQISVGHVNTDGIMDICVGTKLGLFVFLGQ